MPKRRRERDRPKAGPESAYNPKKRVLLSYASDEEETEVIDEPLGTGHLAAVESATADYTISPYPEDEEEHVSQPLEKPAADDAAAPAQEGSLGNAENEQSHIKPAHTKRKPTRNEITGMWPALGSLSTQRGNESEGEDAESYDSTEEEAMAYLKAVR